MSEWKQKAGELPYLEEFPQMYRLSAPYPNSIWKQKMGELPYKEVFPQMHRIGAPYPVSVWLQKQGELPYRLAFPKMYKVFKERNTKAKAVRYVVKLSDYKTKVSVNMITRTRIVMPDGF